MTWNEVTMERSDRMTVTPHKRSMLYLLQLEIKENRFQNAIHFNILFSTRKAQGENYNYNSYWKACFFVTNSRKALIL